MSPQGREAGAAGDRESSLVNPPFNRRSVLPVGVSVRPGRVFLVRSLAPGCADRRRSGPPVLCRGLIGLPRRRVRVPRRCGVRAARFGLLPRGRCGSLPGCAGPLAGWRAVRRMAISHAAGKARTPRAMTSTAAGPGRTRVRRQILPSPPGRGCRARSPWPGPQVVTPSPLGRLRALRESRAGPLKGVASRRRLA